MSRLPAVALVNPKYAHNVGQALRACSCWGVDQLYWTGDRMEEHLTALRRLPREERMKGYAAVDWARDDAFLDRYPRGEVVPVAVEVRPQSEMLVDFVHPEKALYVFGPEDGSIPKGLLARCHRFVCIPTHHCLNLAAAVNVVLYDRRLKRIAAGLEPNTPIQELLHEHRGFVDLEEILDA